MYNFFFFFSPLSQNNSTKYSAKQSVYFVFVVIIWCRLTTILAKSISCFFFWRKKKLFFLGKPFFSSGILIFQGKESPKNKEIWQEMLWVRELKKINFVCFFFSFQLLNFFVFFEFWDLFLFIVLLKPLLSTISTCKFSSFFFLVSWRLMTHLRKSRERKVKKKMKLLSFFQAFVMKDGTKSSCWWKTLFALLFWYLVNFTLKIFFLTEICLSVSFFWAKVMR